MNKSNEDLSGGQSKDHVVASNGSDPACQPVTLSKKIRNQRQRRTTGFVISFALVSIDDDSGARREDRPTERHEPLGWLSTDQALKRQALSRSMAVIYPHKVDCVSLSKKVGAMAGHPPLRAVLDEPSTLKWQVEDDPVRWYLRPLWRHRSSLRRERRDRHEFVVPDVGSRGDYEKHRKEQL